MNFLKGEAWNMERNRFSGKHRMYLRRMHEMMKVWLLHKLKKGFHAKLKGLNMVN